MYELEQDKRRKTEHETSVKGKGWRARNDWLGKLLLSPDPPFVTGLDGGFERRVMLIALLPPAGNMYSRNVRTKTTCKRHIFAPPPRHYPACWKSNASGTNIANEVDQTYTRRQYRATMDTRVMIFRWIVGAICMVIFRDYAPSNLRRLAWIYRFCEKLQTGSRDGKR